ncbi:hypothetical protein BHM03_00058500 [Ensete ventricosum]|nr:hypothetical protein BHM03_00058500 [Ensete ventricosum]
MNILGENGKILRRLVRSYKNCRKNQAPWLITVGTQKTYVIRDTLCLCRILLA